MRTVCGLVRRMQSLVRGRRAAVPVALVRPVAAGRTLFSGRLGEQRHAGRRLDQVDATTCGSAVLLAVAAWADPDESARLEGDDPAVREITEEARVVGFGDRFDARQREVHQQTNRYWPRALGTTPWAMVGWLRRHVPAAGPYRVRLVDDASASDVVEAVAEVDAALASGRPVPLLVGAIVARHYVLALTRHADGWRVYEPGSGSVRALDVTLVAARRLGPVLGWDRLHAVLLPA